MHKLYSDYCWKNGVPQGVKLLTDPHAHIAYKIVTDPYHKRYSLEKYSQGIFQSIVYDSLFLDFRKLNPTEQTAWKRETLKETPEELVSLIRNIEDRIVLIEKQYFQNNLCKECWIYTPHNLLVSTQKMFYKSLKDPFNGVILYDLNDKPVMRKLYNTSSQGEFTDLLEECWDMKDA
jgi:hypothetical protein